jgi:hypothetical protein
MPMRPGENVAAYNARMQEETHAAWRRDVPPIGQVKMPHVSQMIVSKFLHHAEVEPPIVVTVKALTLEEVGREDKPEQRWVMWFNEQRKGLRLNVTMIRIFEAAYGSNSDTWIGKRVQLYWDANVSFGGRLTGGVRVRLSRSSSTHAAMAVLAGARFDSMTGKPLAAPAQAQARFDPMTGAPLGGASAPAAGEFTDTPAAGAAPSGIDPDFDDDIPF